MAATANAELNRLLDESLKSGQGLTNEVLEKVTLEISKHFNVKSDEVAIFHLIQNGNVLAFLYPIKLQKVGSIPMTNTVSLAVRTAREKRPEAINSFATQKHPTVFEAVDLGVEHNKEKNPIQKIMSAPLIAEGKVVGVVQISRKGKNGPASGPDFTIKDLTALMATAGLLAKAINKK
jgi:transcriptional regulator with GAF, ATPase, and Fis domain